MEFSEVLAKRRSVRRFKQEPLSDAELLALVEAASVAPSGANAQPLRYVIVRSPETTKKIFELSAWGAHVRPARTPVWGVNAPVAFIAVCATEAEGNPLVCADAGAAIQSMLMKAVDLGLGACWLGAFDKARAGEILNLKGVGCLYLVAVGKPDEEPLLERIKPGDSTKYHLDANDVLRVPKYTAKSLAAFK